MIILATKPEPPGQGGQSGRHDMEPEIPAERDQELLTAVLLRHHKRAWRLMWIGAGKDMRDRHIRAATPTAAAAEASNIVAELYHGSPASATTEFMLLIFGRNTPVFDKGPQLIVAGEPGRLTATDTDESALHGATLDDLLAAAGANPAEPGDYGIRWTRPVSALLDPIPDWT
jgi:hypothetical protein